ncbi:MAG: hypothetical protein MJZ25_03630 [Fibrobacter sp.]|nr:hypothetical protein [Fibrobacter sp.]
MITCIIVVAVLAAIVAAVYAVAKVVKKSDAFEIDVCPEQTACEPDAGAHTIVMGDPAPVVAPENTAVAVEPVAVEPAAVEPVVENVAPAAEVSTGADLETVDLDQPATPKPRKTRKVAVKVKDKSTKVANTKTKTTKQAKTSKVVAEKKAKDTKKSAAKKAETTTKRGSKSKK